MVNIPQILLGLALSITIGGIAYWRRSLTASGWLGAIISGTLTFGFGGWECGSLLIVFFITSSLLSHFRQAQKQRLSDEKFEKSGQRDLAQTFANGGGAALLALWYGLSGAPPWLLACFVGMIATATADTWATELGILNPHPPRLITTWRPVAPGTSGGISAHGTIAALAGAFTISITLVLVTKIARGVWIPWGIPSALIGGLLGSMTDSLLGATLQAIYQAPDGTETERHTARTGTTNPQTRGWVWMNNDMVNFLSSLVGGLLALGMFLLVGA